MDRTPDKIAKLISEDVRTNNGFLFEADEETPPIVDRENVPSPRSGNVDPRISDLAFRDFAKTTITAPIGGSERDNPAAQIFIHAAALIERFMRMDMDFDRILKAGHPVDKRFYPAIERHKNSIHAILEYLDNLVQRGHSVKIPGTTDMRGSSNYVDVALSAVIMPVRSSLLRYASLVGRMHIKYLRSEDGNIEALEETRRELYKTIDQVRKDLREMVADAKKGLALKAPEPVEESKSRSRSNNINEGSMGLKKQTRRAKALKDTLTRLEGLLRQSYEKSGRNPKEPGINEYQTALVRAIGEIGKEMGRASISGSIKNADRRMRTTDYLKDQLIGGRPGHKANVDRAVANQKQANAAQDILHQGGGYFSGNRKSEYQVPAVQDTIRAEYQKRGKEAPTYGGSPLLP